MKMDLFQPIFATFSFLLTVSCFTLEISVLTDERMTMDPEYRNERLTVKHNKFLEFVGLILKKAVQLFMCRLCKMTDNLNRRKPK